MEDNNTIPADNEPQKSGQPFTSSAGVAPRTASIRIPIVTKGQKYVAPAGRHSQQTHRRAIERAATQGHASEQEQHAHDRNLISAKLNRNAEQKLKQQADNQNVKSAAQKKAKETAAETDPS